MPFLQTVPIWTIAALVLTLRIVDVSIGTIRTIMVVAGRVRLAVVLDFFELLIWAATVSHVVISVGERPILLVPYAAGFAVGNAVGILLERRLAIGSCVVRMLSDCRGTEIAHALGAIGHYVTSFLGEGPGGGRTLVYATCERSELQSLLDTARGVDPALSYAVERFSETGGLQPVLAPTGWRAILKKK
jgi:uncharacterized protein YebE (UPF0316 family)